MLFWNWIGFSAKFLGACALTTNTSREWKIVPSCFPLPKPCFQQDELKSGFKIYTHLLYLSSTYLAPVPFPLPLFSSPPPHPGADILTLLHIRQN